MLLLRAADLLRPVAFPRPFRDLADVEARDLVTARRDLPPVCLAREDLVAFRGRDLPPVRLPREGLVAFRGRGLARWLFLVACPVVFFAALTAPLAVFFAVAVILLSRAAARPAIAPTTPPTTAPTGPATLPMTAPAAAPALCLEMGGIWMLSEDPDPSFDWAEADSLLFFWSSSFAISELLKTDFTI